MYDDILFCRHLVYRILGLVDCSYAQLTEQQREIRCSFFFGFLMAAPQLFSRYQNKRAALVADRQVVVAGVNVQDCKIRANTYMSIAAS